MQLLNLAQGTNEWKEVRLNHFTASEAPIMMGVSPYMSRDDLLKYKTTHEEAEISKFTQIVFDKGHEVEERARAIAEHKMGEDLYPVTASLEIEGLSLLSSYDGLTMAQDKSWEHKQWSIKKAELITTTGELEAFHYWQLEHQMIVAKLDAIWFVMSDGTENNWIDHIYHSVPERRARLLAGWQQFKIDLDGYAPQTYQEKLIGAPVSDLPAIIYNLNGTSLTSNLPDFKAAAELLVVDSKKVMVDDQDFADREQLVKKFKDAEANIKVITGQVVGEIQDVDKFCKELGQIGELIRQARINGQNAVKARKDEIKQEVVQRVKGEFFEHQRTLAEGLNSKELILAKLSLPYVEFNALKAIKGKKTVKSLNEAANDALATAKIEANEYEALFIANIEIYTIVAEGYDFLFPDIERLLNNEADAFKALINVRISDHQEQERIKEQAVKDAKKKREEKEKQEQRQEPCTTNHELSCTQKFPDTSPLEALPESPTTNNPGFTVMERRASLASVRDHVHLEYFFGAKTMAQIATDQNGNEYQVDVIVRRTALK